MPYILSNLLLNIKYIFKSLCISVCVYEAMEEKKICLWYSWFLFVFIVVFYTLNFLSYENFKHISKHM